MVGVVARERADPVGAQELVLVQHDREDAPQLSLVHDREEPTPPDARLSRIMEARDQRRPGRHEPLEPPQHLGVLVEDLGLERRGGAERQQADHRPDLEPL